MKALLTDNLKIKFLGITPVLADKTGVLSPQQIVSLSALLTFKGQSIKQLLENIRKKGENLDDKIKIILQKSSLRGHASIATTPSICLAYESSKFLDSALTGLVFSSSLMASGRRTDTAEKDIVYPKKIFINKKAREVYRSASEKTIGTYRYFLENGVPKDEASKILQYGIYGTGIIQLPVESIVGLKREYDSEKDWMPEELDIFLKKIERETKKLGIDWLFSTREVAPRNVYPYPNIFKNPKKTNIVRELRNGLKNFEGSKLISIDTCITPGLKKKLEDLRSFSKNTFSSSPGVKKGWFDVLTLRQEIFRDYNLALRFKMLSSIPWRIWGEKKRHRTVPQAVESIYYCANRAMERFSKLKAGEKKPGREDLKKIEEVVSVPPSVKKNPELLLKYLSTVSGAFKAYGKLIRLGIRPKEAIFLIPRAVKIDILQDYDLYNLLTGYYPLRLCQTAEEEMKRNTIREVKQIKEAIKKSRNAWLNDFIGPKCEIVGFCPEEKSCGHIKGKVKGYSDAFHKEMKENLRRRFEEKLKSLGK